MTDYKPYVPQYKQMGLEPVPYPARRLPATAAAAPQQQRAQTPATRNPFAAAFSSKKREAQSVIPAQTVSMPYAEAGPQGPKTMVMPNVGNNFETSWTSVGNGFSTAEEQTQVDYDHPMIDNNEFVSDAAYGIPGAPTSVQPQPSRPPLRVENDTTSPPADDHYVLLVKGEFVSSGTKDAIQNEVKALVFEEHPLSSTNTITEGDIIVLKRVPINIGVFLGG